MTILRARLLLVTAASLTTLLACATGGMSPLKSYVAQSRLQAFDPPRAGDGVGTIIDFKAGHESVVASADQCLSPANVARGPDIPLATLTSEYTVNRDANLDLSLSKGLVKGLDLTAAFDDSRVATVKIALDKPFEQRITRQSFKTYLDTLKPTDPCYRNFTDPKNFIINYVMGAKGVAYSFVDKSGTTLKIDANILDKIKANPSFKSTMDGKYSLNFADTIYIGYATWKATQGAGIGGSLTIVRDTTPQELAEAKTTSMTLAPH